MPGKNVNIGHDESLFFFPGRSADTFSEANARACNRPLKWTENKFITFHNIHANPETTHGLFKRCRDVGKVCYEITLILHQRPELRK